MPTNADKAGRRALLLGLLAAPSMLGRATAQGAPFAAWLNAWEAVLHRRVDATGRVDFDGLKADRAPLRAVTAWVAETDPRSHPALFPDATTRLAYYLNAYNALAMDGILDRGPPAALDLLGRYAFFVRTEFPVGGRQLSLKSFEDDVIRPLGEERVHFALNCMVRGCPRLPREAFRPERLETQLAAAAREFCGSGYQVRPDPAHGYLWVSQIFQFYTPDFLRRAPGIPAYLNRWRTEPVSETLAVQYLGYDWTVNRQPGGGA